MGKHQFSLLEIFFKPTLLVNNNEYKKQKLISEKKKNKHNQHINLIDIYGNRAPQT